MALTLTLVHQSTSGNAFGAGAYTAASFTPAAARRLLVVAQMQASADSGVEGTDLTLGCSTGGVTSFTPIATSPNAPAGWSYGSRAWISDQSTSGSAVTDLAVDCGTFSVENYRLTVWAVEDYGGIGATATGSTATADGAFALTLGAAPAASSVCVAALNISLSANPFPSVTPNAAWTEVEDLGRDDWWVFQIQTRTGSTSTSVDWDDVNTLGTGNLGLVAFAFEVVQASSDTTAPTLTSPTGSATGSTTATGSVTTDEANGTVYAGVTTSATAPSAAQVRAGQDHTGAAAAWSGSQVVTSTGAKTFNSTGLAPSTTYWRHYHHRDAASNDSAVVSSASFTTPAASPNITGSSSATPQRGAAHTVTGSGFGATQGTKQLRLGGVVQTPTAWADGSITYTLAADLIKSGVPVNVEIWETSPSASLLSNSFALTSIQPQAGWGFVDVGTPNTTAANRLTFSADAASGDQAEWFTDGGKFTVNTDLTFTATGYGTFGARLWTPGDGYGAAADQVVTPFNVTGSGRVTRLALGTSPLGVGPLVTGSRAVPTGGAPIDLVGANSAQAASSGAAAVSQVHVLAGAAAGQAATSAAGAVVQEHQLVGAGTSQAATAGTGAASQEHNLVGAGSSQGAVSGTGFVSVTGQLAGAITTQGAGSGTGAVVQEHVLAGVGAAQPATSGAGAVVQVHQLAGAGAAQAASSGTGVVSVTGQLAGLPSDQASSSGTGAVSQVHVLAGAGSSQAASSSTGAVNTGPALVGANCSQAAQSSTSQVSQVHVLVAAPSVQDAVAAASAVVQVHLLAAQGATQAATSGAAALLEGQGMTVHYATLQDMINRFGQTELIQLTDRSPTATAINNVVLEAAQFDADAEIDSRLAPRFAVPQPQRPRLLVNAACDIARYKLYDDRAPDQVVRRFEDALKLLDRVQKGELNLGLDLADAAVPAAGGPRVVTGGKRVFGPGQLGDYSDGAA